MFQKRREREIERAQKIVFENKMQKTSWALLDVVGADAKNKKKLIIDAENQAFMK